MMGWVVLLASFLAIQDEDPLAPPPGGVELRLELSFQSSGGSHHFEMKGTSNLPKGVRLRARLYALQKESWGLDEQEVMMDDALTGERGYVDFAVEGEAFTVVVAELKKKPFSLPYRARVFYTPDHQEEEIVGKVSVKPFSAFADLRVGTEDDFGRECGAAVHELDQELSRISDLFEELKKTFEAARPPAKFEREKWETWKNDWDRRVREIRDRNGDRYDLWAVWVERQGKMRIEGFCHTFVQLGEYCTKDLEGDAESLPFAQRELQSFATRMEESREMIGVDSPINPAEVRKIFGEYEKTALRMEELAGQERAPDGWTTEREKVRTEARRTLLALVQHLPRRGYVRIRTLLDRFNALFDGCEKAWGGGLDRAELRKLSEGHHAQWMDFRAYAGLK